MFEFIGILFLLIGIICLFIPSQRKSKFFIIPLLLGLGVTYLHTLGPLSGKRQKLRDIIAIDSTSIVEINVFPGNNSGSKRNLVRRDMLISDQTLLNKFSRALNKGTISGFFDNNNPLWVCNAEILKNDGSTILLDISKQGSSTQIRPLTKGIFKFFYGTIEADEVGFLLEEIAPHY